MEVKVNINVNEDVIKTMVMVGEAIEPMIRHLKAGVTEGGDFLKWYVKDSAEKLNELYNTLEDIVNKYNEEHKE